jgi:hypothetical protein
MAAVSSQTALNEERTRLGNRRALCSSARQGDMGSGVQHFSRGPPEAQAHLLVAD